MGWIALSCFTLLGGLAIGEPIIIIGSALAFVVLTIEKVFDVQARLDRKARGR